MMALVLQRWRENMTIRELMDILSNYDPDTNIAIRSKDDFLLTKESIYLAKPYFGNCMKGSRWEDMNLVAFDEEDLPMPKFLIFDKE
jgi:hypothetical protein